MHISVKVDTDSGFNWTLIPVQSGQVFRFKLDSDSGSNWTDRSEATYKKISLWNHYHRMVN